MPEVQIRQVNTGKGIEEILARKNIKVPVINLKTLTGNPEEVNGTISYMLREVSGMFLRSTGGIINSY